MKIIQIFYSSSNRIRQYERHPNPFTIDHHEGWYVVNLWGPVVDRMFDDLEHIDVIRGDASSIASSERKNLNRNFTERKKVGRKIDGLIRNTDGLEYGGMEAGRYYEGEKGTKWLKESKLKLPKLSRDMLVQLDHEKKTVLEELEIVGFVHGGRSLMLIFVDIPKGYICRLTRSIVYEIPTKIMSFYKALELISAVWTAKLKVQRTISIVEQPKTKISVGIKRKKSQEEKRFNGSNTSPKRISTEHKVQEKLEDLISRHEKLSKEYEILTNNNQNSENIIPISKELSELADIINPYKEFKKTRGELLEINNLLNDNSADSELKKLAKEEYESTIKQIKHLERFVVSALIPKDLADEGNAVLEVRAGTGGDEAELFAGEIFKMYEKFSLLKHWKFEKLSVSESDIGATASILGVGVYGDLKYESGVHRVQRVPITEKAGRIHTSTVTVAILPESTKVDAKLKESDLIIQRYRSSGKGGQHVNTTSSAVRIKHIPTGIVVAIQDEPLRILGAKVYDMERVKLQQERSETRKSQVGSGERSEKIRTYNFSQNRITDHRINLTIYDLESLLDSGEILQNIIDNLKKIQIYT
ncbi:1528_t:CDS:10 [Entrophospora sp. SA101]|nr:1528_t:CDS:10 [Entrophospora sp. SA101]